MVSLLQSDHKWYNRINLYIIIMTTQIDNFEAHLSEHEHCKDAQTRTESLKKVLSAAEETHLAEEYFTSNGIVDQIRSLEQSDQPFSQKFSRILEINYGLATHILEQSRDPSVMLAAKGKSGEAYDTLLVSCLQHIKTFLAKERPKR